MVTLSPEARGYGLPTLAVVLLLGAGLCLTGCGPTEEALEDEEWETTSTPPPAEAPVLSPAPVVSPAPGVSPGSAGPSASALASKADSLMKANLALKGQVDALTAENRTMRGRIAELETQLRGAQGAVPAAPAAVSVSPSSDLKAAYAEALDQYMNRNYQSAIQQFEAVLQANPRTDLADNCTYWIGESYYALKNYTEAIRQFERVLDYPSSGKRPYAQFMIGNSLLALGNRDAARDAFNAVVSSYPTSPLVSKAQAKLARLR
jgi:tol-pal system protein YbgF